ncbi:Hemoglobin cathodic subunit beta [Bagarius yarrelli]|uniref:Hemoglobin cathodic subunit beta n=1 Tax=Bagarius yarrelli TaxID=175774 RepID=A0A556V8K5_BAGYA|nr:Hemoglobin cathodic subunit beta [Bagarius yarrelli]
MVSWSESERSVIADLWGKINVDTIGPEALASDFSPQIFADCLTIVLATKFGADFNPVIQATWQKFLAVVVAALSSRYF